MQSPLQNKNSPSLINWLVDLDTIVDITLIISFAMLKRTAAAVEQEVAAADTVEVSVAEDAEVAEVVVVAEDSAVDHGKCMYTLEIYRPKSFRQLGTP